MSAPYSVERTAVARRGIRRFTQYLVQTAGQDIAHKYFAMLERDIQSVIAQTPNVFGFFHETGPPYRAKLFRLARTTYWIVYRVDEARRSVLIVTFWNTARERGSHGL